MKDYCLKNTHFLVCWGRGGGGQNIFCEFLLKSGGKSEWLVQLKDQTNWWLWLGFNQILKGLGIGWLK